MVPYFKRIYCEVKMTETSNRDLYQVTGYLDTKLGNLELFLKTVNTEDSIESGVTLRHVYIII